MYVIKGYILNPVKVFCSAPDMMGNFFLCHKESWLNACSAKASFICIRFYFADKLIFILSIYDMNAYESMGFIRYLAIHEVIYQPCIPLVNGKVI